MTLAQSIHQGSEKNLHCQIVPDTRLKENDEALVALSPSSCQKIISRRTRELTRQIPIEILENEELKAAIELSLPHNYEFEIPKTLWRIQQEKARHIGLQFPEGLLIFASQIATILSHFVEWPIDVTILGDVTYGACCIDDLTSRSIGVDFLVHYGHSCLVPVNQTALNCLYVFVDIVFDYKPLVSAIVTNFPTGARTQVSSAGPVMGELGELQGQESEDLQLASTPEENLSAGSKSASSILQSHHSPTSSEVSPLLDDIDCHSSPIIALMGTIQYSSVLHATAAALRQIYGASNVIVPQEEPLTAGEVLGCTSPNLSTQSPSCPSPTVGIFISDGRFHLESAMIQNPSLPFLRYDPFTMNRQDAINRARLAQSVGIILGTLGRQGSVGIFEKLARLLDDKRIKYTLLLMSEILPDRLERLSSNAKIDAFIQVACPRLSLDWGHFFGSTPLLTPYEAFVAYSPNVEYKEVYPMDYYSKNGGLWTNFQQDHRNGSLVSHFEGSSLTDLEKRRALIRRRAEERRKRATGKAQEER